jgi:DMSO/TMAO reductase YedYZ molybdopterin-dependent catalytic subunit
VLALVGAVGCGDSGTPVALEGREVREYQGERLSSVEDLRENSLLGPQYVDIDEYTLRITGLVEKPVALTYEQVLESPRYTKVVTLNCVEGWDVTILWEGVLMRDVLEQVGVKPEARIAIFTAVDGFTSSLPVSYLINNDILLAYKMNDVVLPPERGFPFQVVAEDKWGYKWTKWVESIELSDDVSYEGTYESFGYDREGDLRRRPF